MAMCGCSVERQLASLSRCWMSPCLIACLIACPCRLTTCSLRRHPPSAHTHRQTPQFFHSLQCHIPAPHLLQHSSHHHEIPSAPVTEVYLFGGTPMCPYASRMKTRPEHVWEACPSLPTARSHSSVVTCAGRVELGQTGQAGQARQA